MRREPWKRKFLLIGVRHISAPDEKSRETMGVTGYEINILIANTLQIESEKMKILGLQNH